MQISNNSFNGEKKSVEYLWTQESYFYVSKEGLITSPCLLQEA